MKTMLAYIFVVAALCAATTSSQSSCTSVLISMSPCLNYITGNSSSPSPSCCQQLANVVSSQPRCLCQVLNGGGPSLGVAINQTRAMALPTACNVQTPPVSRCNAGGSPTTPPTTKTTDAESPSGSKSVPTTGDGSSSDANSMNLPFGLMVFLLFTSSYASVSGII
ncbi:hypothetical protein QQ045_000927 [Rhodiola kirilowii]